MPTSTSQQKRGAPSRSPSPKSGGHVNKKPRVNGPLPLVIDLTGNSDDDEDIKDVLDSIEAVDEVPRNREGDKKVVAETSPALGSLTTVLHTPSPKSKEEGALDVEVCVVVADVAGNDEKLLDYSNYSPYSPIRSPSLVPVPTPAPAPVQSPAQVPPPSFAPHPASAQQPPRRSSPDLRIGSIEVIDLTGDTDDEAEEPLHPNERERSPRSPTPSNDHRIALWAQETRRFAGEMIMDTAHDARFYARIACTSRLWVNNVPQIIIFCDGSSRCVPNMTFHGTNGGYGVVVRNPWAVANRNGQGSRLERGGRAANTSLNNGTSVPGSALFGFGYESGFYLRSWSNRKMYSSTEAELAAIAQSFDTTVRLIQQHNPDTVDVQVFTDSQPSFHRIVPGLKHRQDKFFYRHTEPVLRALIWLSHRLKDLGGKLKLRWNPRRCAIGPDLADDAASEHLRGVNRDGFCQRNLPLDQRDGILDMLHEQIGAIVRGRETPAPPGFFLVPDDVWLKAIMLARRGSNVSLCLSFHDVFFGQGSFAGC
ncbi:hypothetical protein B0T13DRAFT_447227 [Neurospora crassa]|nr:hypothetical protein B0T13DRAFT_447227 [Neurospora crassa]